MEERLNAERREKSRASQAALESLLKSEQQAYKTQQLIIEELATSNEPAHVIVGKRRAGVSTMERDTLAADLLAQVPSLRRLKQTGMADDLPITDDDAWITAPLDTVDPLPHTPAMKCVEHVLSTVHNIPFAVDELMAAGGLTMSALVMQALMMTFPLTK